MTILIRETVAACRGPSLLVGSLLGFALVAAASPSFAAVNCAQVNRYLQTGRSVEDVSMTMVVPEDEVRRCQEEAAAKDEESPKESPQASDGE